jgi:hypothetical protein
MPEDIERFYTNFYKKRAGIEYPGTDPTFKGDTNLFHLLAISESESDSNVVAQANEQRLQKRKADATAFRFQAMSTSSGVEKKLLVARSRLSDKRELNKHREELWNIRFTELDGDAKRMKDAGTAEGPAKKGLRVMAQELGFPCGQVDKAVSDAMAKYKPWPTGGGNVEPLWKVVLLHVFAALGVVCGLSLSVGFYCHPALAWVLASLGAAGAGLWAYRKADRKGWAALREREVAKPTAWSAGCVAGVALAMSSMGLIPEEKPLPSTPKSLTVKLHRNEPGLDTPLSIFLATPSEVVVPLAPGQNPNELAPAMAADGDESTCWTPVADCSEQWTEFAFKFEWPIDGVLLLNGPPKGVAGSRVRSARLEFDSGPPIDKELEDVARWQFIPFEPRKTKRVRLVVQSVYAGHQGEKTTCLREIWYSYSAGMPPSGADWSGRWFCSDPWGEVNFVQDGNWVSGSYEDGPGVIFARSSGETLVGTWLGAPFYQPPQDGGDLCFAISADRACFSGKSWSGSSRDEYSGEKVGDPCAGQRERAE